MASGELGLAQGQHLGVTRRRQIGQAQIPQAAPADGRRGGLVGARLPQAVIGREEVLAQRGGDVSDQTLPGLVDALHIDDGHLLGEIGLAGEGQDLGEQGRLRPPVGQGAAEGRDETRDAARGGGALVRAALSSGAGAGTHADEATAMSGRAGANPAAAVPS